MLGVLAKIRSDSFLLNDIYHELERIENNKKSS
jgi:hypothetical protein